MARPFSAALFLAAFRSNFYAEFWDGASPLSPSPPHPRTECGFCLSMLLLDIIITGTLDLLLIGTVHARPSRTGKSGRRVWPA